MNYISIRTRANMNNSAVYYKRKSYLNKVKGSILTYYLHNYDNL